MSTKKGKILVVDDNSGIRRTMEILLPMHFAEVRTIASPNMLVSELKTYRPDVVLLDMNFTASINSGGEGLYWLGEIKRLKPTPQVVLFTAYADIQLAVEGMKRGAFDFVTKPVNLDQLEILINRALETGRINADNSDIINLYEAQRYYNLLDCHRLYLRHKKQFTPDEQSFIERELHHAWQGIDTESLPFRVKYKPAYMPLHPFWRLFCLQQQAYHLFRSIKPLTSS